MDLFTGITSCLRGATSPPPNPSASLSANEKSTPPLDSSGYRSEKPLLSPSSSPPRSTEDIAAEIVTVLRTAEKAGSALQHQLDDIVGTTGWTENIAKAVLGGIVKVIQHGAQMSGAMRDALERAVQEATDFAKEHPVYFTILALGVLVSLAPWVLGALGFGELGPIGGSFAAAWQSRYAGYVPKGSLFSFFQRLGMVWK